VEKQASYALVHPFTEALGGMIADQPIKFFSALVGYLLLRKLGKCKTTVTAGGDAAQHRQPGDTGSRGNEDTNRGRCGDSEAGRKVEDPREGCVGCVGYGVMACCVFWRFEALARGEVAHFLRVFS
jgi:hypothetical protein